MLTEMEQKTDLKSLTLPELQQVLTDMGEKAFRAKQLYQWMHEKLAGGYEEMSNLSVALKEKCQEKFWYCSLGIVQVQESKLDGTRKYLFALRDGNVVESVWMKYKHGNSVCISSQVGCRMGCRFCMTGRQGFEGNLTAHDILNQIYALPQRERLTNVVFMGQGEPMDNLDAVLQATSLLTSDDGWAWSPKRITVSTVGVRKGLERFLEESDCHLAISLHNPFPAERAEMMPAERAYSLTDCIKKLKQYDWSHQRRLSFEYIVFEGLNDTERHARELVRLLGDMACRVNLIRFHTIPESPFKGASEEKMVGLRDYLTAHGVTTTIRASRGEDIMAACGLLNTATKKNQE